MRTFFLALLALYAATLLWCGAIAQARYDAELPLVSLAGVETAAVASSDMSEQWFPCLPEAAIHWDEAIPYVYVADERQGYFGTESFVRQVPVQPQPTIALETEGLIAIQSGSLSGGQLVVSSSSKPLFNGETVRLAVPDERPSAHKPQGGQP